MSEPAFSVLVATYNQAPYVAETLDTVAAQTCADWEMVIVNDGSTDDTGAVVAEWVRRFRERRPNRVVFLSTPNGGQSAAMERGFSECRGRWIALLDSDDRWLPRKLEATREAAAADPEAGMIVHPLLVIDSGGRRTGDVRPMRAKLSEGDLREHVRRTGRQVAPATSGVAIRADVFAALLPMSTRPFRDAADAHLTLGASLLAPVRAIPEPLAEYRMHAEGNYLKRFATPEGLRYTVELERTIARHFGLEGAAAGNPYFARNLFALAKLEGGPRAQAAAWARLVRATLADPSFSARDRALLAGFWTAALPAPRRAFAALWGWFQRRHTGTGRTPSRSPESPSPARIHLCGTAVDGVTLEQAVERIVRHARARGAPANVVTPNAQHLCLVKDDARFAEAYRGAWLSVADGVPLVWAARLLGTPLPGRVNGTDLFERVSAAAAGEGLGVFLLGGRPGAAAEAARVLQARHPGLRIAGTSCPPMGFERDPAALAKVEEEIRAAAPDLLFVGLGAPKQEVWMHEYRARLGVPVTVGIGGSFEMVSGRVPRAPRWMQRAGLEWLFRLGREPRRLVVRYATTNPRFVWMVLRQWMGSRRPRTASAGAGEG